MRTTAEIIANARRQSADFHPESATYRALTEAADRLEALSKGSADDYAMVRDKYDAEVQRARELTEQLAAANLANESLKWDLDRAANKIDGLHSLGGQS